MLSKLLQPAPEEELLITKITRPFSFWILLITFIILIFLNSFGYGHLEKDYLDALKLLLITIVGFYFSFRGAEKISSMKYKNSNNEIIQFNNNANSIKNIDPDKLKSF